MRNESSASTSLEGADETALAVAEAFRHIQFLRQRLLGRRLAVHGLPPAQGACLRALGDHGEMTQRELGRVLDLSPAALTGLLQRMESSGLVERWSDPGDQRVMRVRPGETGRALQAKAGEAHRWILDQTLLPLPEADRLELLRLLRAVGANFEAASGTR
nr:MarR family transcriptional regulator [uncultured Holophaga sp.]